MMNVSSKILIICVLKGFFKINTTLIVNSLVVNNIAISIFILFGNPRRK